ncbi:uncharacterized protein LOC115801553 [Delphinapterus leucas]|uniref:Uncharacterized protein LOC115801553 n=1 Tax=Delphinapterus leucas TaxID=9749 RepID=A0A7F8K6A4_DELLE|nr:uncharacterized protein LOC115801553 [Delphinapterus leucas]
MRQLAGSPQGHSLATLMLGVQRLGAGRKGHWDPRVAFGALLVWSRSLAERGRLQNTSVVRGWGLRKQRTWPWGQRGQGSGVCQVLTGPYLLAPGKRREQRPVLLGGAGVLVGQGGQGRGAGREGQRVASHGSLFGSYCEGREAVTKFGAGNGLLAFATLEMPQACPGRRWQRCGQRLWRGAGQDFRLDTGVRRQTLGPVRGCHPGRAWVSLEFSLLPLPLPWSLRPWRGLAVCPSPAPASLTLSTTVHDGHKPPGLCPRGHVAHGWGGGARGWQQGRGSPRGVGTWHCGAASCFPRSRAWTELVVGPLRTCVLGTSTLHFL